MESRRDFLKKAALLGATVGAGSLPESIKKAFAIDPARGSTYLNAEHVVILMQENRSFDHCYGTLQGVRGFNDPRAFVQPNQNPVWLQTNQAGETYAPFRLDLQGTNATWMGSLPHAWSSQVDARNNGRYDRWLSVKQSRRKEYAQMPLTMGHYTRDDIPFYFAFADAFTVCDQNFSSALAGTTPNRLFLFSGTNRERAEATSPAKVFNEEADHDHPVDWTTFPERLEDHGISWKVYQNEVDVAGGFHGEEQAWLSNFSCNPLEFYSQFNARFAAGHRALLARQSQETYAEVESLRRQVRALSTGAAKTANKQQVLQNLIVRLNNKVTELSEITGERDRWSADNFAQLNDRAVSLHQRAFCTNVGDPHYRSLEPLTYKDGSVTRKVQAPRGDVLHQFRQDVSTGQLPAVSWLVGPEHFSGHPSSPWYGAWYLSEVLDILTKNPEVWKKTIFILTYDENDGYFDHVPPFVAPAPDRPETGLTSKGIDTSPDYIDLDQDRAARPGRKPRESSIGLGYRVPMVIASPWSRGGWVCSEVFDHTSVLRFLETFISRKTHKKIEESNISPWRRTVTGDLTSAFRPYFGERVETPAFVPRDAFIESIHRAQFKGPPTGYRGLAQADIDLIRQSPASSSLLPSQEPGVRRSCALPYELYADGAISMDGRSFDVHLAARNDVFGKKATGSPFNVTAYTGPDRIESRSYAVSVGDMLSDGWTFDAFADGQYHVRVDGPNGFFREFRGASMVGSRRTVRVWALYADAPRRVPGAPGDAPAPRPAMPPAFPRLAQLRQGALRLHLLNYDIHSHVIEVQHNAYMTATRRQLIRPKARADLLIETARSHGWYDFTVRLVDADPDTPGFEYRYAGRVETGRPSVTDPAMGRVNV